MYIGAAYYPELWCREEINRDIDRCRQFGINVLRIGEFAWEKMEPSEGVYSLDWLEEIVTQLHRAGISTILCTPTCTPPRRFLLRHPEVLQVSDTGIREEVSSRCHICKTSPLMRKKNREITEVLAKRFGSHPGVIGWQIDNELFPYHNGCYCDACVDAFRKYLKKEYGTIEQFNLRLGMSRWSLSYSSFEEILPPRTNQWRHPSLRTVWRKFQCEQIASYSEEQADILHRYSKAPVGTDMMPNNLLSYYRLNQKTDVVQFNHYNPAEDLPDTAFSYDFLRPIKKAPFWVTETQVGWNGSEFAENGSRPAGNCYMNSILPFLMGGEANLYWLFRAHPAGHELAHGAVFSPCGRPYAVSREIRRVSEDLKKCGSFLKASTIRSDIALHYSSASYHNFSSAPMLKGLDYRLTILRNFYSAFSHYNLDVIDEPHSLEPYRVLISPFFTTFSVGLQKQIRKWVEAGGTWIVGPMSDILTEDTVQYTDAPFSFLEEFAGVYTTYRLPTEDSSIKAKWENGDPFMTALCYDAFEPVNSRALVTYDGGDFDGLAAVTERKVGKGKVILLGTVPSHAALLRLTDLAPIAEASDNIRLIERDGDEKGLIAAELCNRPGTVTLNGVYEDILHDDTKTGTVPLRPYEFLILKKKPDQ